MQISCVDYKKLDQGTRLDAEYYKPGFLQIEKILRKANCKLLDDVSKSIKSFGAYALCNEMVLVDQGIPFIRCKDIKEGFVDFSEVLYINEATHRLLSKSAVTSDIVMLTMSGTVGNSTIADPAWKYPINSNQDIAKIETNELINPYYLTIFLNGKYGKSQTERLPVGSIQQHIFIWQLKGLLILVASKSFQNIIAKLYMKGTKSLSDSEVFYRDAEQILLSELGLVNWKPEHRLSFVKNFSDTQASERIDAEYYQPMYEKILNRSKDKVKTFKADEIFTFRRGDFIDTKYYTEQKTKRAYIRIKELSNIGSINSNEVIYLEDTFNDNSQNTLKENDIVMAIIGDTIGKSNLILKEFVGSYFSNNTGRFRLRPEAKDSYDPFYLETLFHSVYIQSQIERAKAQTGQPKIADKEVKNISIPCISLTKQKQISNNIKKAIESKDQSKRLLDIAKRGVEIAIEKSEKEAEKWIKQQLDKAELTF